MRKYAAVVILLLTVLLLAVPVYADENVVLKCEPTTLQEDGMYEVSIIASGIQNVSMVQFEVIYGVNQLSCVATSAGEVFNGNTVPTINSSIPGKVILAWESISPINKDGSVLKMIMKAEDAVPGILSINHDEDIIFADESFICRAVETEDCTLGDIGENGTDSFSDKKIIPSDNKESVSSPHGVNNGITLSANSIVLTIGKKQMLTTDIEEQNVKWSSSDDAIAAISELGEVEAKRAGTAIIEVQSVDGESATCVVTVLKKKIMPVIMGVFAGLFAIAWVLIRMYYPEYKRNNSFC